MKGLDELEIRIWMKKVSKDTGYRNLLGSVSICFVQTGTLVFQVYVFRGIYTLNDCKLRKKVILSPATAAETVWLTYAKGATAYTFMCFFLTSSWSNFLFHSFAEFKLCIWLTSFSAWRITCRWQFLFHHYLQNHRLTPTATTTITPILLGKNSKIVLCIRCS